MGAAQPAGTVMQMAYVVPDIQAAMANWIREFRIGPFFLFEKFTLNDLMYRGRPATLNMSLACAYSGSMCVELIQQHDAEPSVYRDVIVERGYGFHHCAIMTRHFDTDLQHFTANAVVAMQGTVPELGARVVYLDTRPTLGAMTELIESIPATELLFTTMRQAAVDWDGAAPIRSI